ncbi:hypothetical protein Tco_1360005, partial [Tanacetum coccineum]
EDEVLPAEEHPLPVAASPTADSSGYVPESDPEDDPEEDNDEDPEEDPADYPVDGGYDGDDEDKSSDDEKIMMLILRGMRRRRSTQLLPTLQPLLYQLLITSHLLRRLSRLRPTKVARLLAIPTPPPLLLSPWSSPLPQIPSPPLPAPSTSYSPPPHIILSHTRADTPPSGTPPSGTPPLLPIPLPTSSPSLLLPSADHGADRLEVCLPPRKRLYYGFVATIDMEIMQDLERDVGYGITNTWDEMLIDMPGAPATDDTELGRRMTEFATRVRQDTNEIYVRLDDEQTERQLMAGRVNMLYKDRHTHARTAQLMEREARIS